MSDNTAQVLLILGSIAAIVALIVTGHGGWVVVIGILFFVFIGS